MLQKASHIQAETPRHDPVLAAPVPPDAPLPVLKYIWTAHRNAIAAFHTDVYMKWIVETKLCRLHTFILNDPAGFRHVLVDNAANYVKGTVEQRIASASSSPDFAPDGAMAQPPPHDVFGSEPSLHSWECRDRPRLHPGAA